MSAQPANAAREWLAKVRTQGQQHCFALKSAQSVCGGAQRTDGRWEVRPERPRCLQCVQRLREPEREPLTDSTGCDV